MTLPPRLCLICANPLPPLAFKYCSKNCHNIAQRQAAEHPTPDREGLGPTNISSARDLWKLKRANLRHLLDLKRAGHSPRRTEMRMKRQLP